MKLFCVEFDLKNDCYMTALRLVAGAVCSNADTDVDIMEDFKVCVQESALIMKSCGFEKVKAVFDTDGGITADIFGEGGKPSEGDCELSLALIGALVESCDIKRREGIIDRVTLKL